MPHSSLNAVARYLNALAERMSGTAPPDHQLLERFAVQGDEAAFTLLVRRHGGMVLGVAQRLLHDAHAAEDVFQETFLALARRAGSIRKGDALASWLYGVASRLASQTRVQEVRRKKRERAAALPPCEDVVERAAWRELGAVVDEELLRLPEKYRMPLVLIYFAGQTQATAARQLGWSLGTLRRRLERGKRLLHDRLLRRGISLSIGLLATAVAQSVVEGALPALLLERTVQEAVQIRATQAAGWLIDTIVLSRAKIVLALSLLLATGAGLAVLPMMPHPQSEEEPRENAPPSAQKAKQPQLDRFGDPLPEGAIARLGTMRFRHGRGTTFAFSPDGKSVLSCGADHVLRTWDLANGRMLREQRLPSQPTISGFVLSSDGRLLAYQDATEGSFCLWDIPRNQLRRMPWLVKDEGWQNGAFSPDSKVFVASSHKSSFSWDLATGKGRLLGKHEGEVNRFSFTADSKLVAATVGYHILRIWDLSAGREQSRLTFPEHIMEALISPDGHIVAAWSWHNEEMDKGVEFWDATTGKPMKDWAAPKVKRVRTVCFAPDSKNVLIGTEAGILAWDPSAGKSVRTLPGRALANLKLSPDGKTVAALVGGGGNFVDPHGTMLRIWNLDTGTPHAATTAESGHMGEVSSVAFAPDGRTVASACQDDGSVRLWDAATGRLLRLLRIKEKMSTQNRTLAFTPDGMYLLAGVSPTVIRWEVASGREVGRYPLFEEGKEDPQHLLLLQLTDDGSTLLAVSQNLGQKRTRSGGYGSMACDMLAWDMKTGKRLRSLPINTKDDWTSYGRFSPDGRWLALPGGGIHDAATGKQLFHLSIEREKALHMPVGFSADGALIAIGVMDEVQRRGFKGKEVVAVQVWEMATMLPVVRLETGEVAELAFTPDGRGLISAGRDALKLWDLASGRVAAHRLAPAAFRGSYGPSFASCVALAPDGRIVATGQHDTVVLMWDLSPPKVNRPAAPLTAAQRETYWNDLAAADASRAFAAIARLADTPAQTLLMLRGRLHPAQAPSVEELRNLLADLDYEKFERREAATSRLRELAELADNALRQALRSKPSLEVRRRIESLLAEPPIVRAPEKRRQLRVIRVLESIGTAEARQVLEILAKGALEARLTREAKAALQRLSRRP